MSVFVIDSEGKSLLPTNSARARLLLSKGKAIVYSVVPFTIKLNRIVGKPVGEFEIGVDDGAKYVGVAVKNTKTDEIVFYGTINHRQDVSRKVGERRNYRKARRFMLRNRKPRFDNRSSSKLAPSIRQRKDVITRVINDLKKRLNITKVIVEEVAFNHWKHKWGKNFSLTEIGKTYLKQEIAKLNLSYESTLGYITKKKRVKFGLGKTHSYDACSIVNSSNIVGSEYQIKPRRAKVWESNPTKTCVEKNGFRHYDVVKTEHKTKGKIIGSVRSLKEAQIALRTQFSDNFLIGYNKTSLLYRPSGLIYCRI